MAAKATVSKGQTAIDNTNSHFRVSGTIALTGSYGGGATHGDTLDISGLGVPANNRPFEFRIFERVAAGGVATGFTFLFNPGTTNKNGVLQILSSQGGGATVAATEYTQGAAYSAALLAANLAFVAWFPSI